MGKGRLAQLQSRLRGTGSDGEEFKDDDAAEQEEELRDIVEDLCMTAEPTVEELGDEQILEMKRTGTLNIDDEETLCIFRKHKAVQGKALFEAENANNVGVEYFGYGDVLGAAAYFKKALELASKEQKPAAKELGELLEFIKGRYGGDRRAFYEALSEGEWRLALSRRRFAMAMKRLEYPGDPDRLFSMLDSSVKSDGKITETELEEALKAKPWRLNQMDRDRPEKGIILSNLAACDMQQGDPTEAMQRLREAAKILHRACARGDRDPRFIRVMGNMATAYILLGDHDSALNYLSTVLTRREPVLGQQHPDVLNTLYQIGFCFLVKANRFNVVYDRKRMDARRQESPVEVNYSLAQCAFKECLRRQQLALAACPAEGAEQLRLDLARSHEVVAEICGQRGDLARAREHLLAAVGHREELLSETEPELLSCWNVLASVCMRSGLFDEALAALEKATAASISLFGEQSLSVATELFHMGLVYAKMGARQAGSDTMNPEEWFVLALEKLHLAWEMQVELRGEKSSEAASTLQLMGSVHLAAGNRREARRSFERALLLRIGLFGRRHAATASSAHALGCLYGRTPRRREEAVQLLRKAVSVREQRLAEDSLHLAESLHELGSVLLSRGGKADAEAALPHLSRAARVREKRLGKQSPAFAGSMHQLGQAHARLGLHSEARLYLQAALALRERLAGKQSAQTAMSRFALGLSLYHLGEYGLAMKQLKASYAVREELFGAEHPQAANSLHQIGMVYVKRRELEAALPFLLRALDILMRLNELDVKARAEDSDEDPRDLVQRQSGRDRRIRKKREHRRQELAKKEKAAAKEAQRLKLEEERERRRKEREREKLKDAEQAAAGGVGMRRSRSLGVIMAQGMRRLKSGTSQASRSEASEDGGNDDELASDSQSSGSGSEGDGVGVAMPGVTEGKPEDEDSEIDMEDVGVDVRGWLAGQIGNSMQLISRVYMDLADFEQSRYYLDRAICLREEVFGSHSQEYGESLHLFGALYHRQGKHVMAVEHFERALHVREKVCGHVHESTALTCSEMGAVLTKLGQYEDASIHLLRAVSIREQLYGPEDDMVLDLKEQWAKLAAEGMHYDPVQGGEVLPHFSKRSAESYLHGFQDRVLPQKQLPEL